MSKKHPHPLSGTVAKQMARFVQRAINTDAPLLAAPLHHYAVAEGLSWEQLAALLDCSTDVLDAVAMCRPPRADTFLTDVIAIADGQVDTTKLLNLLRRIQVLHSFQTPDPMLQIGAQPMERTLLAALDREEQTDHAARLEARQEQEQQKQEQQEQEQEE
jgi:hypothetical protein